jgi:site-specific DNA-methyltransferase (adenine-specific)
MPNIELIQGDCLEKMKDIADGSVDAVLADPPYGTTACKWDSVIPFEPMWEQLNRIIKSNGAIVLFGSEPFSSALRMSNIKNYKYDWVWDKKVASNSQLCKYQPLKVTELIHIFSKKTHLYYPQGLKKCDILRSNKNRSKGVGHLGSEKKRKTFKQTKTNYPKNILKFKPHNLQRLHPTQKPVALMEYLIKTYTNENGTVLDFTMGSGTTGVAAKKLNRNFIGIELDKEYFEIAKRRIENAQQQRTINGV